MGQKYILKKTINYLYLKKNNMKIFTFITLISLMTMSFMPLKKDKVIKKQSSKIINSLNFDCVFNAKDKTSYKVIKTGYGAKILFSGGYANDFIIEIDGSIFSKNLDEVYFVKSDFCAWESNVVVIDDEVFGVKTVSKV